MHHRQIKRYLMFKYVFILKLMMMCLRVFFSSFNTFNCIKNKLNICCL